MGINYAYLYFCFTTFPIVFQQVYHFSEGTSGLAYLGLGIGSFVGLGITGKLSDKIVVKMTRNHGVRKPEYRLPLMIPGHLLIPIGLFWYGWSADKHVHWYAASHDTLLILGLFRLLDRVYFRPACYALLCRSQHI
jgi:MFS family permease